MYQSGRTVKSTARKPAGLTVQKATRDARRCVEKTVPGVIATVNSRTSWDLAAGTGTVITVVTFPRGHVGSAALAAMLIDLPGVMASTTADSSVTITRRQ